MNNRKRKEPTTEPTAEPTAEPTTEPTAEPTTEPTAEPTTEPIAEIIKELYNIYKLQLLIRIAGNLIYSHSPSICPLPT